MKAGIVNSSLLQTSTTDRTDWRAEYWLAQADCSEVSEELRRAEAQVRRSLYTFKRLLAKHRAAVTRAARLRDDGLVTVIQPQGGR